MFWQQRSLTCKVFLEVVMIELGPQGQVSESGDAGAQKGEKRWCEGTKGIHCGDSFRGSVVYLEYGRGWIKKQKKKITKRLFPEASKILKQMGHFMKIMLEDGLEELGYPEGKNRTFTLFPQHLAQPNISQCLINIYWMFFLNEII